MIMYLSMQDSAFLLWLVYKCFSEITLSAQFNLSLYTLFRNIWSSITQMYFIFIKQTSRSCSKTSRLTVNNCRHAHWCWETKCVRAQIDYLRIMHTEMCIYFEYHIYTCFYAGVWMFWFDLPSVISPICLPASLLLSSFLIV